LDLTQELVDRMRMRTEIHELPIEDIKVGSALEIPYADRQFDVVFSHGVLHHIQIRPAEAEIRRVLKSTGSPIIMVYAKHSLNYQVSIRIIRRLGLALLMPVPRKLPGIYERHRKNARKVGPASQFRSPLDRWAGQSVFKGLHSPGIRAGLPELPSGGDFQALDACATTAVPMPPRRALARLALVGPPRTAAGLIAAPGFAG
jgi:SAM-dependent methyltransferase